MKVLLLGATGNLGSRLLQALIAHNHQVVAFVRSEGKLQKLIGAELLAKTTVVTGDATSSAAVRDAFVQNGCDALIMAAGLAAVFPWQAPRMPQVVDPVVQGAVDASKASGRPVRCWFLGGMTLLDVPGTQTQIRKYFPLFAEHHLTFEQLSSRSPENLVWSIMCPSMMVPADTTATQLSGRSRGNVLLGRADSPPAWEPSWLTRLPLIGPLLDMATKAANYNITLEDCADFIAADLEQGAESQYAGHRVGVINDPKPKTS